LKVDPRQLNLPTTLKPDGNPGHHPFGPEFRSLHLIFYNLFCVLFDELSCASAMRRMSEEL
jgi:hypothetical protein